MAQYKCIRFFNNKSKVYWYGTERSSEEYDKLSLYERTRFEPIEEESHYQSPSSLPDFTTYSTPDPDVTSYDSSSNDSTSTDFGGGDFGGGGSSSDY